jgi:hypothetical protein
LQCLLRNIRLFGDGQFRYFKDKLDRKLDDDVANGYSHEYGLARTLTQISYDLNAISQAVLVRLFLSQQIVFTLERADEFAIAMLEPANTAGLFDIPNPPNPAQQVRITAVTYFRQSMRVRVVPYAPVAWEEARALYRWFTPLLHLDTHRKLVQYIKSVTPSRPTR